MKKPTSVEEQKKCLIQELERIIRYFDKDLVGFARKTEVTREYIHMLFNQKITFTFERLFDYYCLYGYSLKMDLYKDGKKEKTFCNVESSKVTLEMIGYLKSVIVDKDKNLFRFGKKLGFKAHYVYPLFDGTRKFTNERLFEYLEMYGYTAKISFLKKDTEINRNIITF